MKYTEKYKDELLERVFKAIAKHHFKDHKMIRNYCNGVDFPRSLGDDIANLMNAKKPEAYHRERRKFGDKTTEGNKK